MESKLRILLAEDNDINMKYQKRILEKNGWEVIGVGNGEEALEKLETDNFDIILMDIQMPVLNGMDTIKIIRENEKWKNKKSVIIAFSAFVREEEKDRFLKSGADGFIPKPIEAEELYFQIGRILKQGHKEADVPDIEMDIELGLKELYATLDNRKEDVVELVKIFCDECQYRKKLMEEYISLSRCEELMTETHTLKSGLLTLRQKQLAIEAHEIEMMCKEQIKIPIIKEKISELFLNIDKFKKISVILGYK